MDIKDLNKSQLILLALLLSFVTSIATGIVTVTLMEQAPESVSAPITRVINRTIERVVSDDTPKEMVLSIEQEKLLNDLKAIKPLEVSVFVKENNINKFLGSGIFLGENKAVISVKLEEMKNDKVYVIKSILGEKKIKNIVVYDTFSIVELDSNVEVLEIPKEEKSITEEKSNTD